MLKAFRIIGIAAALALAVLMFFVGHPSEPKWWMISPLVFAFALSPMGAAYVTATKTSHRELKASMLFSLVAYMGFATLTFYSVFREPDATSGLALVAVPALGWMCLPLVAIATALLIRLQRRSRQN